MRVGDLDARPRGASSTPLAGSTSPDGRFVVRINNDNTARVFEVKSGKPASPPLAHRDEITYAAFSPNGLRVVTTSNDQTARVWDAVSGTAISPPLRHASTIWFADFDPEGQHGDGQRR